MALLSDDTEIPDIEICALDSPLGDTFDELDNYLRGGSDLFSGVLDNNDVSMRKYDYGRNASLPCIDVVGESPPPSTPRMKHIHRSSVLASQPESQSTSIGPIRGRPKKEVASNRRAQHVKNWRERKKREEEDRIVLIEKQRQRIRQLELKVAQKSKIESPVSILEKEIENEMLRRTNATLVQKVAQMQTELEQLRTFAAL